MNDKIIYADDHLKLYIQQNDVFLETYMKGFPLDKFKSIFSTHHELEISNFIAIKSSLTNAPRAPEKIGSLKERITLEIQNDEIKAHIKFNIPTEELDESNRENLTRETLSKLNEKGIIFGIKKDLFSEELISGKSYVIAEGLPPVNGTDSIIKMYELQESKPEIDKDGNVDFYDLKLINRVQKGDWLGERTEATDGVQGKSIRGAAIKPVNGKNIPLSYDKNTVQEVVEGTKSVLYSKVSGAVNYYDGKIGVSNHLEIEGDVDFRTGNIKFDGYVTIKGTIADGFHVEATNDIEINSFLGLGHIKGITSTKGSIFIKGGIVSKGSSLIKAAKHVFTKFVDNSVIECCGTAHIGFYCINSNVSATEVILDSSNGKIIGGTVTAEIKVLSPVIGSEIEKKTTIVIKGFNRDQYKEYLDQSLQQLVELKNEQQKSKQIMTSLESQKQLNSFKQKERNEAYDKILMIKQSIKDIDEKRRDVLGYLKAKGDGEVCVTKKLYPNCTLIIKGKRIDITSIQPASAYYIQDGEVKQA